MSKNKKNGDLYLHSFGPLYEYIKTNEKKLKVEKLMEIIKECEFKIIVSYNEYETKIKDLSDNIIKLEQVIKDYNSNKHQIDENEEAKNMDIEMSDLSISNELIKKIHLENNKLLKEIYSSQIILLSNKISGDDKTPEFWKCISQYFGKGNKDNSYTNGSGYNQTMTKSNIIPNIFNSKPLDSYEVKLYYFSENMDHFTTLSKYFQKNTPIEFLENREKYYIKIEIPPRNNDGDIINKKSVGKDDISIAVLVIYCAGTRYEYSNYSQKIKFLRDFYNKVVIIFLLGGPSAPSISFSEFDGTQINLKTINGIVIDLKENKDQIKSLCLECNSLYFNDR